jgi:inner membrane protein
MTHPAVRAAAERDRRVSDFLYWSRLPFADVREDAGSTRVTLGDARYSARPGDGVFTVRATVVRAP